jgi:hypothetical protein
MSHDNLIGPEPVRLPADGPDADARAALTAGSDLRDVARENPASSYVWALLAERALADDGDPVAAYAYARTGYHRGLDALRRAGWRGQGPIPTGHEPNEGVLRALLALEESAEAIGEQDEVERIARFLADCGTSEDEISGMR